MRSTFLVSNYKMRCCRRIFLTPFILLLWTCRLILYLCGTAGGALYGGIFMSRFFLLAWFVGPSIIMNCVQIFLSYRAKFFVPYGRCRRQDYDVFFPPRGVSVQGTVVLIPGGAWTVAHKSHTMPLVPSLLAAGLIAVCTDLRQFPQANCESQVDDVILALRHIRERLGAHKAPPGRLYVIGHSAGAHLLACALARSLSSRKCGGIPLGIRRTWLVSGTYDITALRPSIVRKGLPRAFVDILFDGDDVRFSPTLLVGKLVEPMHVKMPGKPRKEQRPPGLYSAALLRRGSELMLRIGLSMGEDEEDLVAIEDSVHERYGGMGADDPVSPLHERRRGPFSSKSTPSDLGFIHIMHGQNDRSCSVIQAQAFATALWAAGIPATLDVNREATHTSMVLEEPLLYGVAPCGLVRAVLDRIRQDALLDEGPGTAASEIPRAFFLPCLSPLWALAVRALNPF
jgi:acetyl esterase/lipase